MEEMGKIGRLLLLAAPRIIQPVRFAAEADVTKYVVYIIYYQAIVGSIVS